ncbi:hypothetical protein C8Q75DRAFT_112056 [Abortiporus biennis]|nr:hypothetical protein C8Q75DRAFT_112056 [Abortiporus biennis]
MSPPAGTENSSEKCRLAEILQYSCDVEISGTGPQYHCWPIPRIFRICPGRPAVEVTRYVHVNGDTGEVIVPATLKYVLDFLHQINTFRSPLQSTIAES